MVTKKAVESLNSQDGAGRAMPPYPTSPNDTSKQPAFSANANSPSDLIDMREARSKPRRDSDVSSHGTWDTDDEGDEQEEAVEISKPLHITPSKQNLAEKPHERQAQDIPAILKPGPAHPPMPAVTAPMDTLAQQTMANPWADNAQALTPQMSGRSQSSTNPYLKSKMPGEVTYQPWTNSTPPQPYSPPPSIPQKPQASPPPPVQQQPQAPPSLPPPPPPGPVELPVVTTPAHELAQLSLNPVPTIPQAPQSNAQAIQRKPITPIPAKSDPTLGNITTNAAMATPAMDSWQQPASPTAAQKWGDDDLYASSRLALPIQAQQHHNGGFDPIPEATNPPSQHTVPTISVEIPNDTPIHERFSQAPATTDSQRNEHYQIKHINWQDGTLLRQSPILTQNANGPCPLLALVNALVLTTPAQANTALVETLRTREQVSLGLLLDAVFDELMSGRRGDSAAALPDVTDLYAFLLALHTGMNVNPRFIPLPNSPQQAGSFEQTREMRLYSTFSIRLIHGWVPDMGSPPYQAFERRAQSFEEAQNIQFAEAELEDKLQAEGLTSEEQQILQDIQTIKLFLNTWPTQLTDCGLQAISTTLRLGQFAILFRNDHFSTIYKEPTHGALMTLVTDTGYSSHDEIVWESLVDVNGAASELFSGDFRTVSHDHNAHLNQYSSGGGEEGWQTVPSRQHNTSPAARSHGNTSEIPPPLPGPRPAAAQTNTDGSYTEQEDHDFALALQLQEEEDARQRQEQDRRREEQQLSEQFLSGQNEGRPPAIPPRRGGSRQSTSIRPPVNRPADESSPDAPPTYEQSASDRPYREGNGQSAPLNAYDELRRQQEQQQAAQNSPSNPGLQARPGPGYGRHSSQLGSMPGGFNGRRPGQAATAQDADERCTIM